MLAHGICLGVIQLRGNIIPVIDYAALLGYREPTSQRDFTGGSERLIVMKFESELFGLLVDSVDSIVSYFADQIQAIPVVSDSRPDLFQGCLPNEKNESTLLLNPKSLLTDDEIETLTHGHSRLFKAPEIRAEDIKKRSAHRKTYITFTIENTFAVPIEEVREIITMPDELMHPPGLPDFIEGVLNLRGELISIINSRSMYRRPQTAEGTTRRVLIFKFNDKSFGLIVDSVEEIVTFSESDKMKLPDLLYQNANNTLMSDLQEATQITLSETEKRNVLILRADSIFKRIQESLAA